MKAPRWTYEEGMGGERKWYHPRWIFQMKESAKSTAVIRIRNICANLWMQRIERINIVPVNKQTFHWIYKVEQNEHTKKQFEILTICFLFLSLSLFFIADKKNYVLKNINQLKQSEYHCCQWSIGWCANNRSRRNKGNRKQKQEQQKKKTAYQIHTIEPAVTENTRKADRDSKGERRRGNQFTFGHHYCIAISRTPNSRLPASNIFSVKRIARLPVFFFRFDFACIIVIRTKTKYSTEK